MFIIPNEQTKLEDKMQKQKMTRRMAILFLAMLWLLSSVAAAQTYEPDMDDLLKDFNLIPIADPYCNPNDDEVYENLSGIDQNATMQFSTDPHLCTMVSISEIPDEVVDWVLVELRAVTRSGSDPAPATAVGNTVIARKPAFLLTNGRIVDAEDYAALAAASQTPAPCTELTEHTNCPDLVFDEGDVTSAVQGKDLYLVIRHRNHLDIMSSAPLTAESSGVYPYDFTGDVGNTYGSSPINPDAKDLGKIGMYSGDANRDGRVNSTDYTAVIAPTLTANDYSALRGDVNFDRRVNSTDYTAAIQDKSAGSRVPN